MSKNDGAHLRTKYVLIDTQAFRKARCDWNGRSLSKIVDLAKQDRLSLLVTDVTVREVKSQLDELLAAASSALSKHSVILDQLGASLAVERIRDQTAALGTLEAAFDEFLKSANVVHVPLISDVQGVLEDYFARRPPFSTKKKAEFPDAISIASVRFWCEQNRATAYITLYPRIQNFARVAPNPVRFST
jgi:PIN domain